jgi:hypothetical protein
VIGVAGGPLAYAAAPELAFGAAELLVLTAWVVLIGVLYTYRYTFGALILKLADMVDDIWLVGDDLADALEKLDHVIQASLSAGISGLEETSAKVWHALTWSVDATGDAILAVSAATHSLGESLVHAVIPAQVDAKVVPLGKQVARYQDAGVRRANEEAHARARGIDVLGRDLTAERLARERGIDYVGRLVTQRVIPRVNALDHALDDLAGWTRGVLGRRVGRLEAALGAGVIGAAAIAALTRVFPYWRCTNVRRFNKALCRSPIRNLRAWESLLDLGALFALDVLVATDLCAVVNTIQTLAKQAEPALLAFVSAESVLLHCPAASYPDPLPIGPLAIPPASSTLTLAT